MAVADEKFPSVVLNTWAFTVWCFQMIFMPARRKVNQHSKLKHVKGGDVSGS